MSWKLCSYVCFLTKLSDSDSTSTCNSWEIDRSTLMARIFTANSLTGFGVFQQSYSDGIFLLISGIAKFLTHFHNSSTNHFDKPAFTTHILTCIKFTHTIQFCCHRGLVFETDFRSPCPLAKCIVSCVNAAHHRSPDRNIVTKGYKFEILFV